MDSVEEIETENPQNPEPERERELAIYPNPTTGLVTIDVPIGYNGSDWQCISPAGVHLRSGVLKEGQTFLDLSVWSAGMYWLKIIRVDGTVETFKIIRQ